MIPLSKTDLRKQYLDRRRKLSPDTQKSLSSKVLDLFFKQIDLKKNAIIAGYWPMNGEVNDLPILQELQRRGYSCALPHVVGEGEPLRFLQWKDGMPMATGKYGIQEPLAHKIVRPDIILVPLAAFDMSGHRLGYGGGFYDRTLQDFSVLAVGLAYEMQRCEALPAEDGDMRLDVIVTDENLYRFGD